MLHIWQLFDILDINKGSAPDTQFPIFPSFGSPQGLLKFELQIWKKGNPTSYSSIFLHHTKVAFSQ